MEETVKSGRRLSRPVGVGNVTIGGGAAISVQSMTKTDTRDVDATVAEIHRLQEAGCQIIRVAVPDENAASSLGKIVSRIDIPLVADIHFNYELALIAVEEGVGKLRINPGNIGSEERILKVAEAAKKHKIPLRVGVNAGSLEKRFLGDNGEITPEAMVQSALDTCTLLLDEADFDDLVVSLKASHVPLMIDAYRLFAEKSSIALHLGLTEAGAVEMGTIKSAIGIGALLKDGIGDTIRVSLTADPVDEVKVGKQILKSVELLDEGVNIISCPSCGRCQIDLNNIVEDVVNRTANIKENLTVAVMGCAVNGPGEAMSADIGIAGGKDEGLLFVDGKVVRKVKQGEMVNELMKQMDDYLTKKDLAEKVSNG